MLSPSDALQTNLSQALKEHFGFTTFIEGQEKAIQHILEGRDVTVIMPTGSGKSLCFQLAAMLMEGTTVVISPLIALMKDQVDGLTARGLPATCINSSLNAQEMSERMAGLRAGHYKLIYVAPERFRHQGFLSAFKAMKTSMIAIDEAHCISQWGHDFRPDYLRIKDVLADLGDTRIMALTATATPDVRTDIATQLALGQNGRQPPVELVFGFSRPNLHLAVTRTSTHVDKLDRIQDILLQYDTGIIYCATRKQAEKVHTLLSNTGQACCLYHGGLTDSERGAIQDSFMNGEVPVAIATNAFGMGVDRSDVRFVVHWDIPGSVEAYYQEVGRAGRDRKDARCELLYNYADVRTQEFFMEGANPTREEVDATWKAVRKRCSHGPATRSLEEWTGDVKITKNSMALRSAMTILERAGLIQREYEQGSRTATTDIVSGADLSALDEQFMYLGEKRRRDEKKLKTMLSYVNASSCRHDYILNYFGEPHATTVCTSCDRCVTTTSKNAREPTEDEWVILQKILSCAARMEGRFGAGRVVQVLLGSKNKAVLERRLDQLSTYGLLKGHRETYVRDLVEELITDHCLEIATGEYPLIAITERGGEVMRRKTSIRFEWPINTVKTKKTKRSNKKDEPSSSLYDEKLYESLRTWRSDKAREEGVPAYVVMDNKTLKSIAVVCPGTIVALENVKGMGPTRSTKYGDDILEILDTWRG